MECEGIHYPVSVKATTKHPTTKRTMYVGKFKGNYLLERGSVMLTGEEKLKHIPYKRLRGPVYDLDQLQKVILNEFLQDGRTSAGFPRDLLINIFLS